MVHDAVDVHQGVDYDTPGTSAAIVLLGDLLPLLPQVSVCANAVMGVLVKSLGSALFFTVMTGIGFSWLTHSLAAHANVYFHCLAAPPDLPMGSPGR